MYSEKVKIKCTDKGTTVEGDIISLNRDKFLEVAINTVKIKMAFREKHSQYVGNMAGLEFIVEASDLPEAIEPFKRRR